MANYFSIKPFANGNDDIYFIVPQVPSDLGLLSMASLESTLRFIEYSNLRHFPRKEIRGSFRYTGKEKDERKEFHSRFFPYKFSFICFEDFEDESSKDPRKEKTTTTITTTREDVRRLKQVLFFFFIISFVCVMIRKENRSTTTTTFLMFSKGPLPLIL